MLFRWKVIFSKKLQISPRGAHVINKVIGRAFLSACCQKEKNRVKIIKYSKKGSYTVEAAVVFPFTAAFWVAVLFFFRVLQVETEVQEALFYAGRMAAVEAGTVENDTALLASAVVLFEAEVSQYPVVSRFVSGGNLGISLLDSKVDEEILQLRAEYSLKLPFSFFGVSGLKIVQNSNNRKWNGKIVETDGDGDGDEDDVWVYVTDYGSVYHRSESCSYLNPSIHTTTLGAISSLRNRSGGIYYACSGCNAGELSGGIVYYTNYGTNYHSSLSCSGLKRTTKKVRLSEVEGMRACSKCGGE